MNRLLGAIYLILAASIWGGMYGVSKYALAWIPPFTLLWIRYVIAVIVLCLISFRLKQHRVHAKDWRSFAWIGFIGYFASVGCQFVGTAKSDAHTGALITSASPIFIVLFAKLFLKEAFTSQKLFSLLLSLVGVCVVIGFGSGSVNLWGDVLLVMAAVTWALLSVSAKQISVQYSSLTITAYALLCALLFTTPFAAASLPSAIQDLIASPPLIWSCLYLGVVSTAGAFFFWNKGLELLDAGTASLFFFFQPLVGSLCGWLLLGERLSWNFIIGGVVLLTGVLIGTYPFETIQSKRKSSNRPSENHSI